MSSATPADRVKALVPEFAVTDWRASRRFYCDVLGFHVLYERPEEGFVYLALGDAELMLDQVDLGRTFGDRHRPADYPFGRGVNLQILVKAVRPMLASLEREGVALRRPLEDAWYRKNDKEVGNRQFVVADPDGYLLRFFEDLGERKLLKD